MFSPGSRRGELNMDSNAAGKWRWVVNPNDTGVIR